MIKTKRKKKIKKKMKEGLDNKFSDEFYQKANAKRMKEEGNGI